VGSERAADAGAFCFEMVVDVINGGAREGETVKKNTKLRPWTKEDIRTLKTLARENTKTTVIAHRLKRTSDATRHKASALGVSLGGRTKRKT
jgi:hypothetical protein